MGIVRAAIILSAVVIVPTLAALFPSGRGLFLRVPSAVPVLPLAGVWLWFGNNLIFSITIDRGVGWTELACVMFSLAIGAVGAVTGEIGRAIGRALRAGCRSTCLESMPGKMVICRVFA